MGGRQHLPAHEEAAVIHTVTLNPSIDKTVVVPGFAPDRVNRVARLRLDPGGKGVNVSRVVASLGATSMTWLLAGGSAGDRLVEALAKQGVEARMRRVDGETRTNLKVVDPVLGTHTDINEPGPEVSEGDAEALLADLVGAVLPGDVVVLAGSLPRGLPTATYAHWARACSRAGAKVFLDADGDALREGVAAAPWLVKPNEQELAGLAGRRLGDVSEVADAARSLLGGGVARVVVSLGAEGAVFADAAGTWLAHAVEVPVGSTVGAGDSVVAALALAKVQAFSREDAMRLAMATGAAAVMREGTQAPTRTQVEGLVGQVRVERLR